MSSRSMLERERVRLLLLDLDPDPRAAVLLARLVTIVAVAGVPSRV